MEMNNKKWGQKKDESPQRNKLTDIISQSL